MAAFLPAPRQLRAPTDLKVSVFVDGDALREVIAYDCDEGWAEVFTRNDKGGLIVVDDGFQTHRITGDVRAMVQIRREEK